MKIYKSKIDWWFGLVLIYPIFLSVKSIICGQWIGIAGLFFVIGLILLISKTTQYIINYNALIVKSFWIINCKIEISKITTIEKSKSIISSPALSLDRLRIRYNKYDEVLISPKERIEFIDDLIKINPNIEIKF